MTWARPRWPVRHLPQALPGRPGPQLPPQTLCPTRPSWSRPRASAPFVPAHVVTSPLVRTHPRPPRCPEPTVCHGNKPTALTNRRATAAVGGRGPAATPGAEPAPLCRRLGVGTSVVPRLLPHSGCQSQGPKTLRVGALGLWPKCRSRSEGEETVRGMALPRRGTRPHPRSLGTPTSHFAHSRSARSHGDISQTPWPSHLDEQYHCPLPRARPGQRSQRQVPQGQGRSLGPGCGRLQGPHIRPLEI